MAYVLKRTNRQTLQISVNAQGQVIVRAPHQATQQQIDAFVRQHQGWIEEHVRQLRREHPPLSPAQRLSDAQIHQLADQALADLPGRVLKYAALLGVTYGRITVRNQRSRWGSCSSNGNLSFNCLLMLMPPEVIDYVVVHELCHRKEMNHSPRFYALVQSVLPDYRKQEKWLKEHGGEIIRRMVG